MVARPQKFAMQPLRSRQGKHLLNDDIIIDEKNTLVWSENGKLREVKAQMVRTRCVLRIFVPVGCT